MTKQHQDPILILRLKGPATKDGRIALKDLLTVGKNIQTAVDRVARLLAGEEDSRKRGTKPKDIAECCQLQVVALNKGSFEIGFDLPRERFEEMDPGVHALETLFEGWNKVQTQPNGMPEGFDIGVLDSLNGITAFLGKGVDEIDADLRTKTRRKKYSFKSADKEIIARQMKGPETRLHEVSGLLLMVDFSHGSEKCRIYPASGSPISCTFDESIQDLIYEHLRKNVKVSGEANVEAETGRIMSLTVKYIEPLALEGETFNTIYSDTFWQEKSLEQLAGEQGIESAQPINKLWGAASDLWADDEDFESFLTATQGIQSEVN